MFFAMGTICFNQSKLFCFQAHWGFSVYSLTWVPPFPTIPITINILPEKTLLFKTTKNILILEGLLQRGKWAAISSQFQSHGFTLLAPLIIFFLLRWSYLRMTHIFIYLWVSWIQGLGLVNSVIIGIVSCS